MYEIHSGLVKQDKRMTDVCYDDEHAPDPVAELKELICFSIANALTRVNERIQEDVDRAYY